MDLDHKAAEDLSRIGEWTEDSLGYARRHDRPQLASVLEAVRVEVELGYALLGVPSGEHLGGFERRGAQGKAMRTVQRVGEMADKVLARQARDRARQTGEPFEEALVAVRRTEAGRQLEALRDGPHGDERAKDWQESLAQERARERRRGRVEERKRAEQAVVWERFMRAERRELEQRKAGQLARLLGEPLSGEPPAALRRLATEDRRQAEDGLVALMKGGEVSYKLVEELCERDMPARAAANRLRTTWLKERRDGWLGSGPGERT